MTCATGDCNCYQAEINYYAAAYNVDSARASYDQSQESYFESLYTYYHCGMSGSTPSATAAIPNPSLAALTDLWKASIDSHWASLQKLISIQDKAAEAYKASHNGSYPLGYRPPVAP